MCTAISYNGNKHYFGRNLDLEYAFREQVVITPRNFPFSFRSGKILSQHYAMIGMATVANGYPLYYEATNESGLSIAGLHFPKSAVYYPKQADKENLAPYELMPCILGQCENIMQARQMLQNVSIWALPFSREFPLSPLHWLLSDRHGSITIESTAEGLMLYDNPVGILTNEPPFPYQLQRLSEIAHLQSSQDAAISSSANLSPYSSGLSAIGLPGDYSSSSRFMKTAFVVRNSLCPQNAVSHFFHLLQSVAMPAGSVQKNGQIQFTRYSSCCDTENGIYYYTTYENLRPRAVQLAHAPLDSAELIVYDLLQKADIFWQN